MKKSFKIDGMSCNHCVMSVQNKLLKLQLNKIKVDIGSVDVEYDEFKVNESEIIQAIEEVGYKVVK